jgi:hypothetical protein
MIKASSVRVAVSTVSKSSRSSFLSGCRPTKHIDDKRGAPLSDEGNRKDGEWIVDKRAHRDKAPTPQGNSCDNIAEREGQGV